MKYLLYISITVAAVALFSCQNGSLPAEPNIEGDDWNNERTIKNIKFEHQTRKATITNKGDTTGSVNVTINFNALSDQSNIAIQELLLSHNATASVEEGDLLDFENGLNTIAVTSQTGKNRYYTVKADSFSEDLVGTYEITGLSIFGGTAPEFNGVGLLNFASKDNWPENSGPEAELDNIVTFELDGITEEGNTYGTITNSSGEDGEYADFMYVGDPQQVDVNHFYRKIPKGKGEWMRDYSNGTITFTFPDGRVETIGEFETAGTENLGNDISKTVEDFALSFQLNGSDDWDNIYSDYDKYVSNPRKYWIEMSRQ